MPQCVNKVLCFGKVCVLSGPLVKMGVCYQILSGADTNIQEDPWIPTKPNFTPIPLGALPHHISWVFQPKVKLDSAWDINLLSENFDSHTINQILKFICSHQISQINSPGPQIPMAPILSKQHIIQIEQKGSNISPLSNQEWKHLWKLKILGDKIFLWKIAWDASYQRNLEQEMASK